MGRQPGIQTHTGRQAVIQAGISHTGSDIGSQINRQVGGHTSSHIYSYKVGPT